MNRRYHLERDRKRLASSIEIIGVICSLQPDPPLEVEIHDAEGGLPQRPPWGGHRVQENYVVTSALVQGTCSCLRRIREIWIGLIYWVYYSMENLMVKSLSWVMWSRLNTKVLSMVNEPTLNFAVIFSLNLIIYGSVPAIIISSTTFMWPSTQYSYQHHRVRTVFEFGECLQIRLTWGALQWQIAIFNHILREHMCIWGVKISSVSSLTSLGEA